MKAERQKIYWIIIGALLFNWLFWNEKMALNSLPYDLFLLRVLFSLYPKARHTSTVRWLLAGHLICLAMIQRRQEITRPIRDMYNSVPASYIWAIRR